MEHTLNVLQKLKTYEQSIKNAREAINTAKASEMAHEFFRRRLALRNAVKEALQHETLNNNPAA